MFGQSSKSSRKTKDLAMHVSYYFPDFLKQMRLLYFQNINMGWLKCSFVLKRYHSYNTKIFLINLFFTTKILPSIFLIGKSVENLWVFFLPIFPLYSPFYPLPTFQNNLKHFLHNYRVSCPSLYPPVIRE